jgi:hypothetical protein
LWKQTHNLAWVASLMCKGAQSHTCIMLSNKKISVFYLYYDWNIVESGVKHNNPNPLLNLQ